MNVTSIYKAINVMNDRIIVLVFFGRGKITKKHISDNFIIQFGSSEHLILCEESITKDAKWMGKIANGMIVYEECVWLICYGWFKFFVI